MGRRFRKKHLERSLALDRIRHLFEVARERVRRGDDPNDPMEAAHGMRAARLGRRIALRYQTGLPGDLRMRYCRACDHALVPGQTARVRVRDGAVRATCLGCGEVWRHPYLREQKQRRQDRALARRAVQPAPSDPEAITITPGAKP